MQRQITPRAKLVAVKLRKIVLQSLCMVLLATLSNLTSASSIVVLTSRFGAGYDEVLETLRQELNRTPDLKLQVLTVPTSEQTPLPRLPEDTVMMVTVGLQAAQHALKNISDQRLPLLNVLLPRASFDGLINGKKPNYKLSALFIDQPPQRQLNLVKIVLPSTRNVGLIVGPANGQDVETYRVMARSRGLNIVAAQAVRETELYPVLQSVLRSADVLLALPDPIVINASTAQNLLLTSFRFRVPVIGYSASYVRAGALAAVYSTPHQLGLETGQIVKQYLRGGFLPEPKYPRYFTVSLNLQLADSLGFILGDEVAVTQRLQQLENVE